jgi:hypothetical protein
MPTRAATATAAATDAAPDAAPAVDVGDAPRDASRELELASLETVRLDQSDLILSEHQHVVMTVVERQG